MDNGVRFKQDRPLDWVSITDHAEYLGIADQIREGNPELLENPQGKRWYEMSKPSPEEGVKAAIEAVVSMQTGKPVFNSEQARGRGLDACHRGGREVEPSGVFTTLHGFEWTSRPAATTFIAPSSFAMAPIA